MPYEEKTNEIFRETRQVRQGITLLTVVIAGEYMPDNNAQLMASSVERAGS